jgi:hypothetical protein
MFPLFNTKNNTSAQQLYFNRLEYFIKADTLSYQCVINYSYQQHYLTESPVV